MMTMNYTSTLNDAVCEATCVGPRPLGATLEQISEGQLKALAILTDIANKLHGKTEPPEPRGADNLLQFADLCAERMAMIVNGLQNINEAL